MNSANSAQEALPSGDAGAPQTPPASQNDLISALKQIGDEFTGLFGEIARLLGVESRLFISSLLMIAILAVLAGFVLAGAVVFLGAALALLLTVHGGLDPVIAVLLVVVTLIVSAAGIFLWIRRLARNLKFNHSRRMLAELATRKPTEAKP
jgi:hypothetical protein